MEFSASDFFNNNNSSDLKRKKNKQQKSFKKKKVDTETLSLGGVGEEMLKAMGWEEGKGVGKFEQGIKVPIKPTKQIEREGIGETKTHQENVVSMKLKHYGEGATDEKIQETIKIEERYREIERSIDKIQTQLIKKYDSIDAQLQTICKEAATVKMSIESINNNDIWLNKGKEIVNQIKDTYEELDVDGCIDSLQIYFEWCVLDDVDDNIVDQITNVVVRQLVKKGIEELSIEKAIWRFEQNPNGPYYEFFLKLKELTNRKFASIYFRMIEMYYTPLFNELITKYLIKNSNQLIQHFTGWYDLLPVDIKSNHLSLLRDALLGVESFQILARYCQHFTSLLDDKFILGHLNDLIERKFVTNTNPSSILDDVCAFFTTAPQKIQSKLSEKIVLCIKQTLIAFELVQALLYIKQFTDILSQQHIILLFTQMLQAKPNKVIESIQTHQPKKEVAEHYLVIRRTIPDAYISEGVEEVLRGILEMMERYADNKQ
ncbi:hypothetical protein QTN25_007181 [Entamoeba marina]